MKPLEAIRCTLPSCPCECFAPGKTCLRTCETCKHGWVAHALDKLGYRHIFNLGIQVEIVQPNIVFDIASLMLYGAQGTPIRLKILLDRLFSVLQHEEVLQVLHGFGWSYEDYARGYILQDTSGRVLDKWIVATREEEHIIIQQFLRFGETKSIAQEIILQETRERQDLYVKQTTRNESEIKKFIERSNMTMQNFIRPFDARHLFGTRLPFVPTGSRLMSPPAISMPSFSPPPASTSHELRPPVVSVGSTSPNTTSPLGRLQTMQPFDYRRDSSSPAISPGQTSGEKAVTTQDSPKSESPQNLSTSSTSAQSTPPPFTPQKMSDVSDCSLTPIPATTAVTIGGATMMLPVVSRPEENGVINFSVKEDPDLHHSIYADKKVKHLRKSSNPIKRQWMPSSGFGTTMIGPNGKKRVLCTACNKTFCDKGALKIHYSAVHLKEMHKCSVEGCSMMFSSRRSRNRHSANPNPKLHMPQKRPKMPDGATMIDDGSSPHQKRPLSTPPTMVISPGVLSQSPIHKLDAADQRPFYADPCVQMPLFPSVAKKLKLDDVDEGPKDLSLPLYRREVDQQLDVPSSTAKDYQDESPSDGEKLETGSTTGPQRSQSRRKNIPTRCAQPDDMFMMSDDNSDDKDPSSHGLRKKSSNHDNGHHSPSKDSGKGQEKQSSSDGDGHFKQTAMNGRAPHDKMNALKEEEDSDDDDDAPRGYLKIDALMSDNENDNEALDFSRTTEDDNEDENMSVSSEPNSNSLASNDSSDYGKINGDLQTDFEIPLDKDNPRRCVACGKTFLNHFGVKIHYQNVHLKLMHKCQVEGCNAAFPSKRSRDRHSCNLNLHRKLLSTSDSDQSKEKEDPDDNQNFRADIIQKLYASQDGVEDGEEEGQKAVVKNGHGESCNSDGEDMDNMSDQSMDESMEKVNGLDESGDDIGTVDSDGMVTCHVCQLKVRDNLVLKEHFEMVHPKEMFRCTIKGCEKIFSTRKSRNRHSQNDNLHRHIGSSKRVAVA